MTAAPRLILYKSSAGSGKTYTLTREYLKLALQHPQAFRQILAVTFTNKATQEMKERILSTLRRIDREGLRQGENLDEALLEATRLQPAALRQRAKEVLRAILHDYASFSVSTIDAFFQKVVRAFAREMDLNARYEVELDQRRLLEAAVDGLMLRVTEDPQLLRWLVEHATSKIQDGRSWNTREDTLSLSLELFSEQFQRVAPAILQFLAEPQGMEHFKKQVLAERNGLLKRAHSLRQEVQQLLTRFDLVAQDFSGGSNSFMVRFTTEVDSSDPFRTFTPTQLAKIQHTEGLYAKTSKKKAEIEQAAQAGLLHYLQEWQENHRRWKHVQALYRHLYVFGLLQELLRQLQHVKEEENVLLISDANAFLAGITQLHEAPFIYEKVGNHYQHFLMDEFQDTSGFQWNSFRPLLENSLAQGQSNLLVGDVKQSIYRWRGGDLGLLLQQVEEDLGHLGTESRQLQENYRSLPRIIQFNNALFTYLAGALGEEGLRHQHFDAQAAARIQLAYADVAQGQGRRVAPEAFQGEVTCHFCYPGEEEEGDGTTGEEGMDPETPEAFRLLEAKLIALQEAGYALRDIAFLTRTKQQGFRIAEFCLTLGRKYREREHLRFDVLSDESMFLQAALSVRALVAALQVLFDPTDQVATRSLWHYLYVLRGEALTHALYAEAIQEGPLKALEERFRAQTENLRQLPLLDAVETLIHLLGLMEAGREEQAYVAAFKEEVYLYSSRKRADLAGFLAWWAVEQNRRTVKVPDSHDAMRILTIHKAKGLQFKVVLMPFLDWPAVALKNTLVWAPAYADQPAPIVPIRLEAALQDTPFGPLLEEEQLWQYLDALNMLYVALTRAEEVFWSCSQLRSKREKAGENLKSVSEWLLNGTQVLQQTVEAPDLQRDEDHFRWGQLPERLSSPSTPSLAPAAGSSARFQPWSSRLALRAQALDFSEEGLRQRARRQFGMLVHELLETAQDQRELQHLLQRAHFAGRLNETEYQQIAQQFEALFERELMRSWYAPGLKVLREQGIYVPQKGQRRPDRIVFLPDAVHVIDFKTGEPRAQDREQVLAYRSLVEELQDLPVKAFVVYVDPVQLVALEGNQQTK
ncbi:MAG: UvrD-helicase domain-containing protein [Nitritalea sp.]